MKSKLKDIIIIEYLMKSKLYLKYCISSAQGILFSYIYIFLSAVGKGGVGIK